MRRLLIVLSVLLLAGCTLLSTKPSEVKTTQELVDLLAKEVDAMCSVVPTVVELGQLTAQARGEKDEVGSLAARYCEVVRARNAPDDLSRPDRY